ncbi:hypothetical protein ACUR5C_12350 [Aliikangiella sp. IMCC44653]
MTFSHGGGYVDIAFDGGVSVSLLNQVFMELIAHSQFKYNLNACYDYSNAYPDISMPEIEEHASLVQQNLHLRGSTYKLALVATDTLASALLSVYKLRISKTSVEAEVFSSKKSAITWLLNPE